MATRGGGGGGGGWQYQFISSPEPKAQGELIVWDSSRRPCVRPSVRASVHTFKHEYL